MHNKNKGKKEKNKHSKMYASTITKERKNRVLLCRKNSQHSVYDCYWDAFVFSIACSLGVSAHTHTRWLNPNTNAHMRSKKTFFLH